MKVFLFVLPILLVAGENLPDEWNIFKVQYNKRYADSNEESYRMKIFFENKKKIDDHNYKHETGLTSFAMKMNVLGDLTFEEYMATLHKVTKNITKTPHAPPEGSLPDSVDWKEKGAVKPVKNACCGSAAACSVVGALEAKYFLKTGKLVSLSEQNLIDCVFQNLTGLPNEGFQYVKDRGIDTEDSYPTSCELKKECSFKKETAATSTGYSEVPAGDETALEYTVASAPVAAVLDASHSSFQFYSAGIYDEQSCNPEHLSIPVLVVGYDNDNGDEYWIVRIGVWGVSWGTEGFMKLARNSKNQCGIATMASYPTI